jgi:hypothetical protein
MMTRRLLCAALLLAASCDRPKEEERREMSAEEVAELLGSVEVKPGQWESTTEIVSASGPLPKAALDRMVGQRSAIRNCITPEQAARPSANFLAAQQGSDCTYRDFRVGNGRLSGQMACTGGELPGSMTTTMDGRYGPEAYDMAMDMVTPALPGGGEIKIRARTRGSRTGDCA